jgi:hypothetical protein
VSLQRGEADAVEPVPGQGDDLGLGPGPGLALGVSAAMPADSAGLHEDARQLLGALGRRAKIFNVYSAGDSGEGCEVIEFATPSGDRLVAWTARVCVLDGRQFVSCTLGWE